MSKIQISSNIFTNLLQNTVRRNASAICFTAVAVILLAGPVSAYAAHPACNSELSDTDGDGWGWENNRSCIVTTDSTQPLPVPGSTTSSDLPVCESSGSDPDGDGYGWENNRSCLVTAASEASSNDDPAPQPSSDEPASPSTDALRFMALGDSITHGVTRDSAKSYRHDLTRLLSNAGCRYSMVGSQQTNLGHRAFVSPHEGYNGHRADHFLTGLNNFAGNNEGVSVAVNRYRPNVVLLHLGTNDMLQNQVVENTVAEIDQVISTLLDAGADVLVANVIPVFFGGVQSRVRQLGDQLQSYVAQLGNSRVRLVDVRSGFTNSMMLSDNLHPNPAGEAHIASAFFNAVQNAGKCLRP